MAIYAIFVIMNKSLCLMKNNSLLFYFAMEAWRIIPFKTSAYAQLKTTATVIHRNINLSSV